MIRRRTVDSREQPSPAAATPRPTGRTINPEAEARRLNRQAADALRKLGLAVEEEPAFRFRP
jgi:hypothetical protein